MILYVKQSWYINMKSIIIAGIMTNKLGQGPFY